MMRSRHDPLFRKWLTLLVSDWATTTCCHQLISLPVEYSNVCLFFEHFTTLPVFYCLCPNLFRTRLLHQIQISTYLYVKANHLNTHLTFWNHFSSPCRIHVSVIHYRSSSLGFYQLLTGGDWFHTLRAVVLIWSSSFLGCFFFFCCMRVLFDCMQYYFHLLQNGCNWKSQPQQYQHRSHISNVLPTHNNTFVMAFISLTAIET